LIHYTVSEQQAAEYMSVTEQHCTVNSAGLTPTAVCNRLHHINHSLQTNNDESLSLTLEW